MRICNSPWKHRHSPKRIGRTGKKNKHLHRTSCGWSPTSASWCVTSRGLSESTTSRKPGVRIGLRLPTLRRTRPYFNPPKCPANKSLNILSIGLGFFQTISSFPGSSFLNLDHGEEIEQLFQYLVLTTVFLYPQKSRAMQDSPAVGRWPWFVSFPLVYQAFAWPNQCRIHSFWMTIYIYIYIRDRCSLRQRKSMIVGCFWLLPVPITIRLLWLVFAQNDCTQQWSVSNYW